MKKSYRQCKIAWPLCVLLLPFFPLVAFAETETVHESPDSHRLGPRDTLRVYIETITDFHEARFTEDDLALYRTLPPGTGFVFTVRDNGTMVLPHPLLHSSSIKVESMTVAEVQSLLRRVYVEIQRIVGKEATITVTLIPPGSHPLPDLFDEPFSCDFGPEVSLQFVLDNIHAKTAIPVVVGDKAVETLGNPQSVIVHTRLPFRPPLKNALDYLVRQHDLTWHFKDGVIHITDTGSDPARQLVDRVYYVQDLARQAGVNEPFCYVSDPDDLQGIAHYIRATVAPDSWNGETALIIGPNSGTATILVRQTEAAHAQIAQLLGDLWSLKNTYNK